MWDRSRCEASGLGEVSAFDSARLLQGGAIAWGSSDDRDGYLRVPEAGRLRSGHLRGRGRVRTLFPAADCWLLMASALGRRDPGGVLGLLF